MQEWPEARASLMNRRTARVSSAPRLLVGSSRMIRSEEKNMARAMAMDWRSPPDSPLILVCGSRFFEIPALRSNSRVGDSTYARSIGEKAPIQAYRIGSRPRKRLLAIERSGARDESWWMVSMPRSMASRALRIDACLPLKKMAPLSIGETPDRALISVAFPAPLSPNRATISPESILRSISFNACTLPNDLLMPSRRISSVVIGSTQFDVFFEAGVDDQHGKDDDPDQKILNKPFHTPHHNST